jgi:hypothetical protein
MLHAAGALLHIYPSSCTSAMQQIIAKAGIECIGDATHHPILGNLSSAKGWLHARFSEAIGTLNAHASNANLAHSSIAAARAAGVLPASVHTPLGYVCASAGEEHLAYQHIKRAKPNARIVRKPAGGSGSVGISLDVKMSDLPSVGDTERGDKEIILEEMIGAVGMPRPPSPTVYMCGREVIAVADQLLEGINNAGCIIPCTSVSPIVVQQMTHAAVALGSYLGLTSQWGLDFVVEPITQRPIIVDLNMGRPNGNLAYFLWRQTKASLPVPGGLTMLTTTRWVTDDTPDYSIDEFMALLQEAGLCWSDSRGYGVLPCTYVQDDWSYLLCASWKGRGAVLEILASLQAVDLHGKYYSIDFSSDDTYYSNETIIGSIIDGSGTDHTAVGAVGAVSAVGAVGASYGGGLDGADDGGSTTGSSTVDDSTADDSTADRCSPMAMWEFYLPLAATQLRHATGRYLYLIALVGVHGSCDVGAALGYTYAAKSIVGLLTMPAIGWILDLWPPRPLAQLCICVECLAYWVFCSGSAMAHWAEVLRFIASRLLAVAQSRMLREEIEQSDPTMMAAEKVAVVGSVHAWADAIAAVATFATLFGLASLPPAVLSSGTTVCTVVIACGSLLLDAKNQDPDGPKVVTMSCAIQKKSGEVTPVRLIAALMQVTRKPSVIIACVGSACLSVVWMGLFDAFPKNVPLTASQPVAKPTLANGCGGNFQLQLVTSAWTYASFLPGSFMSSWLSSQSPAAFTTWWFWLLLFAVHATTWASTTASLPALIALPCVMAYYMASYLDTLSKSLVGGSCSRIRAPYLARNAAVCHTALKPAFPGYNHDA